MNDLEAKELLVFIANNLQVESAFLTPNPQATVDVISLLDKIAELRGISEEQNGIEFNQIMEDLSK